MDPGSGFVMIAILGFIGAIVSCTARLNQTHERGWKSTLRILYSDYVFDHIATITLLSLVYAIGVGALSGASLGTFLLMIIGKSNKVELFWVGMTLLLAIPLLRISLEGYTVIYRTAQDASRFWVASYNDLIKRDPTLDKSSPWETQEERVVKNFGYSKKEIFEGIIMELKELGIDTRKISYKDSSFTRNQAIVMNNLGHQVAVFTLQSDGEWTREIN